MNVRDAQGQTPLIVAVKAGPVGAADLLVEKYADINPQDNAGNTALIVAVNSKNTNAKFQDNQHRSAIYFDSEVNDKDILNILSASL